MSDFRRMKWKSGRLIWTPLRGFWQAPKTLDVADPSIPSLPLETPSGGATTHTADLAAVEAQDVATFSTILVHPITLTVTEAADTAAFASALKHIASFALTEGIDVAGFSSTLTHQANFALTEGADTATFDVTLMQAAGADIGAGSSLVINTAPEVWRMLYARHRRRRILKAPFNRSLE